MFLQISTNFTSTLGVPFASTDLKPRSIGSGMELSSIVWLRLKGKDLWVDVRCWFGDRFYRRKQRTSRQKWLRLCRCLSTCAAAYARFTPNQTEQRLLPSCYRGCWHEVGRSLFAQTNIIIFVWQKRFTVQVRTLRSLVTSNRSRGIAGSGFRPLSKIPHC